MKTEEICPKRQFFVTDVTDVTDLFSMGVFLEGLKTYIPLTLPDFTRHFFSSLTETVDGFVIVVLNR